MSPRVSAPVTYHQYDYKPKTYMLGNKRATLNEYNLGLALDFYQISYNFQVSYWGGRNLLGGQILDFVVFLPKPTPVQVFGAYWHSAQLSAKDNLNLIRIEALLSTPAIIFWQDETETFEAAKAAVAKKLL
jgi:hypothetical protein